ncbi:hypothetical protein TTHERM_00419960 (macronuclear) [Tetrahymena thermophila SB210]|uniref:Transmembrane protein n=1 Tax=Tetrahymena thermophila (strain SB210) TaxID=312017 RepID=I7MD67_TETTS|nr:hypothetical protein TTHERM_00419960 [Tetrahymena thermophila SB210]EAR85588.1 hypothetical protein TTHERM_00419960 [Tetrahymena thermophila SB210]|eukprot:XP_001033251.1 hypothetical protein TTHERM_00419960 [Tetrahymena thermophila SB210]
MNKAILLLAFLAVSINATNDVFNVTLTSSLKLKPILLDNTTYADYCSYNSTVTLIPTAKADNKTLFTGFNVTGQAFANYTGCPTYYLTFVTSATNNTAITVNTTADLNSAYVMESVNQNIFKLIYKYEIGSDNKTNATAYLPAYQLLANGQVSTEKIAYQSLSVVMTSALKLAAVAFSALFALLF